MTMRTVRLMGHTTGCHVRVEWNGVEVLQKVIDPAGNADDPTTLAEWQTDIDLKGNIPFRIETLSGSLWFVDIHVNMALPKRSLRLLDNPGWSWSKHVPTPEEFGQDLVFLTDSDFEEKYGVTKDARPPRRVWEDVVSIEDNFVPASLRGNFSVRDGKFNVELNGVQENRHDLDIFNGSWHWLVSDGSVFTCDIELAPTG